MGVCHRPGLPLALRLQRRAAAAGFSVNAVSAAMVGLYMTVVFPPREETLLIPVGRDVADGHDLVAPIWFAAAGALGLGFLGTKLATQAVAAPVRQLRRAIDSVTRGELDVAVPVNDGSEVGRLQAGFNAMVA